MAFRSYHTMNGQIIGESGPGGTVDYQLDGLGSVIGTWRTTGTLQNQYRYSGYGQQVHKSGTGADPYFLWVGGWGYRTRGMVYVRRRTYYEQAAVWTSVDPLWPDESAYGYGDACPSSSFDFCGCDVITHPPKVRLPVRLPVGGGNPAMTLIRVINEALSDLAHWHETGEEGTFTSIGTWIGQILFPCPKEMPAEDWIRKKNCDDRYKKMKKECNFNDFPCGGMKAPADCSTMRNIAKSMTSCVKQREWIITNCDNAVPPVPDWTPDPCGHTLALCYLLRGLCDCAEKSRSCKPKIELPGKSQCVQFCHACRKVSNDCKGHPPLGKWDCDKIR